jgi:hypothetical protein
VRRSERGVVAGLEGLVFGALILLGGTVLVVNAWSILDTRQALDGAAREYLRAYTEAPDAAAAERSGGQAVRSALGGRGRLLRSVRLQRPDPDRFGPCSEATVTLSATVPSVRIPFVGRFGTVDVRVVHHELVDAHREVIPGASYDRAATPCGD